MSARADLIDRFVADSGWRNAARNALRQDASNRQYARLIRPKTGETAILMDADPAKGESIVAFSKVDRYLRENGLTAPEIYAEDRDAGLMLIEDFGDGVYDRICAQSPEREADLYNAAVDALVTLHRAPPMAGLSDYGALMTDLALSAFTWYGAGATGRPMDDEREACRPLVAPLIAELGPGRVTILRDYHAQNLIWLGSRSGVARVGMLDFQDAMTGHPAYDLISLAEDARRDVSASLRSSMIERYIAKSGCNRDTFETHAAICAAQRNLRILMIFARMSLHFRKPHYVDLIPRTWAHLMRDLEHPALAALRDHVTRTLPEPTPPVLATLKEKCGTVPTLL